MTRHLLDTGPLVALLNRRDRHHAWARRALEAVRPPVFTCEAVLSEASFLLGRVPGGRDAVLTLLANDVVRADFQIGREVPALRALLGRFADVPMSLADACLVRLAELEPRSVVLTLDVDFLLYRRNRRQPIATLMPDNPAR